jgi:hypothetical protein
MKARILQARFRVPGPFLATFVSTLVSEAYAFILFSTVVSAALASRILAKRWLFRLARLPLPLASSDLAALFLLLTAARFAPFRFVSARAFFIAFSSALSASDF